MKYYLWYSEQSAELYGTWWYKLVDGTKVELTAITVLGGKYNWEDKQLLYVCSDNSFSFHARGKEMNVPFWAEKMHKDGIERYIKNKGMILSQKEKNEIYE